MGLKGKRFFEGIELGGRRRGCDEAEYYREERGKESEALWRGRDEGTGRGVLIIWIEYV